MPRYEVPISAPVRIVVYSLLGQPIRTLVAGMREPGLHLDFIHRKDPDVTLVIGVKMRSMVRGTRLCEHADDDTKETGDLRHNSLF